MMTSENYSAPRRYQIEKSEGRKYHKESDRKETGSYYEDHGTGASDSTDLCTPDSSESGRLRRGRRSKDHISDNPPATTTEDGEIEGATATEKPKSLKKEKSTGKKRKDRKNLREKRRSTGVVIMPGATTNVSMFAYERFSTSCQLSNWLRWKLTTCLFKSFGMFDELFNRNYCNRRG